MSVEREKQQLWYVTCSVRGTFRGEDGLMSLQERLIRTIAFFYVLAVPTAEFCQQNKCVSEE